MGTDRKGWRQILGGRGKFVAAAIVVAVGIVVVAAIAGAFRGLTPASDAGGNARGSGGNRPQPVSVAEARVADLPIWVSALGTAVPRNLVTVRSRVDGELTKLYFREGELVKQGQPLADIDPRPYQVLLVQANGQLLRDTALLKNAEIDLERYQDLWAKDSIAKQQLDTQAALVRQYRGTIEVDRGQVESARLQLAYAHITAPTSGRVGLRQVDPGNQIHASDPNGLVVIAQLQPITVVFAVPETYLPAITKSLAVGKPVLVEGWDRELKNRLASGRLLALDNLVDTATGTIKLKAEFANLDSALFPNQFVNVRLLLGTKKGATVVPDAAIQRGAKGAFVYTVDGDGVVNSLAVMPGPADGDLVAVDGRLAPGTRIVTDGTDKLRDGARVEIISPEARAEQQGTTDGGPPERPRRSEGGAPAAAH